MNTQTKLRGIHVLGIEICFFTRQSPKVDVPPLLSWHCRQEQSARRSNLGAEASND